MGIAVLAGAAAGIAMGYVLQRGQLCFHAVFAGAWHGRLLLLRGWALAVGLGALGLAVVYLLPVGEGLGTGLAFRPVPNVVGGLLIGWGMASRRAVYPDCSTSSVPGWPEQRSAFWAGSGANSP